MKSIAFIVFMTAIFIKVAGSDVVIGILGNSVSIDCKLPVAESIIWESSTVGVIAINSELVVLRTSKYAVETYNGARESLVIHDVTLTDEDEYRCYSVHDKQDVYVTYLNVLVRPHMNVTYPREPVLEGKDVILACEADGGKPLPELTWYKLGPDGSAMKMKGVESSTLYANGTGHISSIVKLSVTRVVYMTSFICEVSVPVFYQEQMSLDLDVHLIPEEPVIRGYTGSYDKDSEIKLECISTGNHPTPTMFWQIDGSRAGDAEFVVIPESNKTSTVTSFLTRTLSRDFDGSVVTCAVRNSVVSARGLEPVSTNITLHMSYKPIVTVTNDHYIIQEGGNVTLECLIDSLPVTDLNSVYWTQNGILVNRGTHELSKNASVLYLHLTKVTRTDAGNYMCHASNRLGTSLGKIKLSVLHAPQCLTNKTQRVPVKVGNIVRLTCQMFAFPTTVILYWRDKITKTIVTSVPATIDNSTEGLVYGQIDMSISSRDQYATIECIGTNTAIGDIQPCLYEIEPPTPAEAPFGCFVNTLQNKVSVTCTAGFDGGSKQVFLLQTQVRSTFLTISNSSTPQFDYLSSTNETIRVCTVNEDFKDVFKCSVQLAVKVFNTGHQEDIPVVAKKVNKMVYVGIGLVCFAGLMSIVTIVILLARNRRKNTNLSPTSPIQEALSNRRRHNPGLAIGEKCWNNVRPANRPDHNANGNTTPAASRTTRKGIQVVCSTPYYGNKQAIFNVEGNSPILQENNHHIQQALQIIQTPESINFSSFGESTGYNVHPLTYDSTSTDLSGQFITINTLHSDAYNQNGLVFCKTIDDVVNKSAGEGLETLKHKIADAQSIDMCAVTLDKDYSAGDIADILDITELDRNDKTFDLDNPNPDIVINGTSLSFNVDFSESDVCSQFSDMSPSEVNSSRDFFYSDCKEEDTSSVSFSSTLGSQHNYVLTDDTTLCNTTRDTKTMNQTYTVPKHRGHPVRNSNNEIGSDKSAALRSVLLQRMPKLSKRNTYLNQHNGQYFERTVSFQCGSNTDSSSDHCDEDLCDVDQCIFTLTNDSNQDSLEVEYDTIIAKETPLRGHSSSGLNRVLSTKHRNNSFRTAIDNSMVDNTTTIPTEYTTKSDISTTVMEMEET